VFTAIGASQESSNSGAKGVQEQARERQRQSSRSDQSADCVELGEVVEREECAISHEQRFCNIASDV
jgi:hypothetical protein